MFELGAPLFGTLLRVTISPSNTKTPTYLYSNCQYYYIYSYLPSGGKFELPENDRVDFVLNQQLIRSNDDFFDYLYIF